MSRNKKLRLLVTTKYPGSYYIHCDNNFNINKKIPVINRWNYEQIIITGGEPLLYPIKVHSLLLNIRNIAAMQGNNPRIIICTTICDKRLDTFLDAVDGIKLTLLSKDNIREFQETNNRFLNIVKAGYSKKILMELNLPKDIQEYLPGIIDLSLWRVKDIEENSIIQKKEDFKRIENLW